MSNNIKIISVFQFVYGEVAFTNFVILKHDGITNKNKHPIFCPPAKAESPQACFNGLGEWVKFCYFLLTLQLLQRSCTTVQVCESVVWNSLCMKLLQD